MAILNCISRSPYRVTVTLDAAPSVTPTDYVLTRLDGFNTAIVVNYAFVTTPSTNTVELALTDQLVTGIQYQLQYQVGPTAVVSYSLPLIQSPVPAVGLDDPEAEVYGVDIDWMADSLTASGDIPQIRGRQCVTNDLIAVALTIKGEIYHRPDTGAGVQLRTNGPGVNTEISAVAGSLKREWAKDDRVRVNGVQVKAVVASTGELDISAKIQTLAINDPLDVKVPGGTE